MSSIPKDKALYEKAKEEADRIYKRDGLYKSAFIQKRYQELGGTYTGKKQKDAPITQWLSEKWVKVSDWIDGKITPCGTGNFDGCRPLIRVNSKTPATLPEIKDKYGLEHIKKKVAEKKKNPNKTVLWTKK